MTSPTLSFEVADAVCRSFLPIGDQLFEIMQQLQADGFGAWVPYQEFVEAFAETSEEREIHRQCLVEQAKLRLTRPWPFRFTVEEYDRLWRSPFVQRLQDERDALNGVPERELKSKYPGEIWRAVIDPCERRKIALRITHPRTYEIRWLTMLEKQRVVLEQESNRETTLLAQTQTFDTSGRYALFSAVMSRDAAALGFQRDSHRSRANYPIYSKSISGDWDLCWAIEERDDFVGTPSDGLFEPYLEIRNRTLRGHLQKAKPGEFLLIRYHHLIPGFGNAYWKFFSLGELETMIKAHLSLYALIAPIIETGLQKVLGDRPA